MVSLPSLQRCDCLGSLGSDEDHYFPGSSIYLDAPNLKPCRLSTLYGSGYVRLPEARTGPRHAADLYQLGSFCKEARFSPRLWFR